MENGNHEPIEQDGPSLATYVETRFNLLTVALKQSSDTITNIIISNDKRYQERFEEQEKSWTDRLRAMEKVHIMDMDAQKNAVTAALASAERAVQKVETSTEKRFESVNEFRSTLGDQQRTLMPRSEVEVMRDGFNDKVTNLKEHLDRLGVAIHAIQSERQGIKGGWGYAVGVVGFVFVLISMALLITRAFAP